MIEANISGTAQAAAVQFSTARAIRFDSSPEDLRVITALRKGVLGKGEKMALYGTGAIASYFLDMDPFLRDAVACVISDTPGESIGEFITVEPDKLTETVTGVLLCTHRWREVAAMKSTLPGSVRTVCLADLPELDPASVPAYAWIPKVDSIYPMDVPEVSFKKGMDLILFDAPARSIAQLPVGFAYVHDAIKRNSDIKFQTVDSDILVYHRYHSDRILDGVIDVYTNKGRLMPQEPWDPSVYLIWKDDDVLDLFQEDIDKIVSGLIKASPKLLGVSLQEVNIEFMKRVVAPVKESLPDLIVVGGGMSCLQPGAAKFIFPLADYVVVGEADITMPELVNRILHGETIVNMPGVWSKDDPKDREFEDGPLPLDLNDFGHPRYEWADIDLYRNWNAYRLAPIVGSRGCSWAKCFFCAERFKWRTRDPIKVVDDLEFFANKGFEGMVFNESDFHGDVKLIHSLCDEIIRRQIKAHYTVQLRCNRHADAAYYAKLKKAGFGTLRFGIDGCSENTLRRQNKGYNTRILKNSLKLATEAGLFTEVNIVIGVPGETESDIDESIELLTECKPWIGRIAFINPLMLFRGSTYWNEPERFNIVFDEDREMLFANYPVAIPNGTWHSENPFIDEGVRYNRFLRVVKGLRDNGFDMTAWVNFTIDAVEKMDKARQKTPEELAIEAGRIKAGNVYRGFEIIKDQSGWRAMRIGIRGGVPIQATDAESVRRGVDLHLRIADSGAAMAAFRQGDELFGVKSGGLLSLTVDSVLPKEGPNETWFVKLVESYRNYNICRHDGIFYAVPIGIGDVNLTREVDRKAKGILVALSLAHAKTLIQKIQKQN